MDPKYLENEERYESIKKEILGDSEEESGESGSEADSEDDEDEEDVAAPEKAGITDMTETNLINLRRTIYLTIMNSVSQLVTVQCESVQADCIAQFRRGGT